jgi:hypothetical protein
MIDTKKLSLRIDNVIPVDFVEQRKHSITLHSMTTGLEFLRLEVDSGGVKAEKGSRLGSPEIN